MRLLQSTTEAKFIRQRCSTSACTSILQTWTATSTTTPTTGTLYSLVLSNVSKGTYCFRAQACTAANVCSAFSATVCRTV
jgi:hypothetical protein